MIDPWIINSFIDSCAFDPKYAPEDAAALELHRLANDAGLPLLLAHSTVKEVEHPNTPQWVKKEAASRICSVGVQLTAQEQVLRRRLLALLAGNGKPEKMAQDTEHIFEAQKYGSCFVTTDKRLLRRSDEVREMCTVVILRPSEFLEIVQRTARP